MNSTQECRQLIDGLRADKAPSGAMNMAIDEVLLQNAAELGYPTLRFYGWGQPTLSLGYFQKLQDRSLHSASEPCALVRRASGGGAIMHDKELTYSFAYPTNARWSDTEETYLAFHETLVDVLAEFGVLAELHDKQKGLSREAFLCFQRRASGDVTLDGNKIMGSAQRRAKNVVLQHGSLLIEQSAFAPELPGLRELSTFKKKVDDLIDSWVQKLSVRLKVHFSNGQLSDTEKSDADTLCRDKFERESWTNRR